MNFAIFIPVFFLFFVIYVLRREEEMAIMVLIKKKFSKEARHMKELATRFIGKECIIYTFNSQQLDGKVTEVTNGALVLLRKDGGEEAINLDFVFRIREYPKKKNGKKKDIVLD